MFGIGFLRWCRHAVVSLPAGARVRVIGGRGFGGRSLCVALRAKGLAADWRDAREACMAGLSPNAAVLLGRFDEIEHARGVLHGAGIAGREVEALAERVCALAAGCFIGVRGFPGRPEVVVPGRPAGRDDRELVEYDEG